MKRRVYATGALLSAIGLAISVSVLVASLRGSDLSASFPWVWRLHIGALFAWGALFLLPGLFVPPAAATRDASADPQPPAPPADVLGRRVARGVTVVLLAVALANFAHVMQTRAGITAHTPQEGDAQYALSRLYTLRAYAGFWVALYGVPLAGFTVLWRESK